VNSTVGQSCRSAGNGGAALPPNQFTAIPIRHDLDESIIRHRGGFGVAGGFGLARARSLGPRGPLLSAKFLSPFPKWLKCPGRGGLPCVTLLFTGLSGWSFSSSRVKWGARASRARRSASRRTLEAEAVRNETLPTATGTVALPSTMFKTSSVQPRWVKEISFSGLTRRNLSRTSAAGGNLAFRDDGDASFDRDSTERNVAADPTDPFVPTNNHVERVSKHVAKA